MNTSLTLSRNRRSRTCSHDDIDGVSWSGVDAVKVHLHGLIMSVAPREMHDDKNSELKEIRRVWDIRDAKTGGTMVAAAGGITSTVLAERVRPSRLAPVGGVSTYVPEVDALRAIAMTAVIAFHCKLMPFGWMGVWLFYVVSGFSVTTSLLSRRHPAASIGAAVGRFYIRRALRIWPLYFAFVVLNVIVLEAIGRTEPLEDLPWLLSFTQNLKMIFTEYTPAANWSAFGHLWTLAVEQQFYLVFPLLLILRGRFARGLVLLGVIAVAPLIRAAVAYWAAGLGWDPGRIAFAVYAFGPAHFDAFAAGSLVAFFRDEISRSRRFAVASMVVTAIIAVVYVGFYTTYGVTEAGQFSIDALRNIVSGILYGQGREITVYLLPTCIGVTILTGILSGERLCLLVCRSQSLQAIGRISYAGYLFHIPILALLGAFVPIFSVPGSGPLWVASHVGLFVCAFLLTVTTARLSFVFFERHFARIRWG
ncbi:acyltransferase [Acidisphaera sp. S103]|uniref:acyltransferase family protein n=1 Tax=Acidisphaera sp. S103 TaxID=1747223 RepID=UPI00131E1778|nr:acyltransferase [Acidisphaera sp. S103]